jgi:hypothetical protein
MWRVQIVKQQNKSTAVMARRFENAQSLDDFPTPPWATRALIEHILNNDPSLKEQTCVEPACGRGYMAAALEEYFGQVHSSDIHNYGYGCVSDFLLSDPDIKYDWLITNPPFNLAESFIRKGLSKVKVGLAVLVRTMFIEGVGRHTRLFSEKPPTIVAQFSERVPIVKGRLDANASSATGYAWLVWKTDSQDQTRLMWVPPCRKMLEKVTDYPFLDHCTKY